VSVASINFSLGQASLQSLRVPNAGIPQGAFFSMCGSVLESPFTAIINGGQRWTAEFNSYSSLDT